MQLSLANEYEHLPVELEKALKALLAQGREAEYLSLVEGVGNALSVAGEEIRVRIKAQGGTMPLNWQSPTMS